MKSLLLTILGFSMLGLTIKNTESSPTLELLSDRQIYSCEDHIVLEFSTELKESPLMSITYSMGSTLLKGTFKNNELHYKIPRFITEKAGTIYWDILSSSHHGTITITPSTISERIESYLGPTRIMAGASTSAMMVSMPVDAYDNPITGDTLQFNYYVNGEFSQNKKLPLSLVAFDIIPTTVFRGQIIASATHGETSSKEFTVETTASLPVGFTLSRKQIHPYADGNHITSISTSQLKDIYGNTVNDGTQVVFYIRKQDKSLAKSTATTINGVATTQLLHPLIPESWEITASVGDRLESSPMRLVFEPAIQKFKTSWSLSNRRLTIGPVLSFMQQLCPDGTVVELEIEVKNSIKKISAKTLDGFATIDLSLENLETGQYPARVAIGGTVLILDPIDL